jgi:hypothetical protein
VLKRSKRIEARSLKQAYMEAGVPRYQLQEIKEEEEDDSDSGEMLKFESEVQNVIFQNYFLPNTLINSSNSDNRRFKRCKTCLLDPSKTPPAT